MRVSYTVVSFHTKTLLSFLSLSLTIAIVQQHLNQAEGT
jgi:hypothetical protein